MKQLLKSIYNSFPFKKQIFSIVKWFWKPPESVYKHLHFKGVIKDQVDKSHSFLLNHHGFEIEDEIFWRGLRGGWEKVSMSLWIELCKRSNVVFDIGSNTGIYTLVAKSMNQNSEVHAFEPVNRVFNKLKGNCELNNYKVSLNEKAASDFNGKATIYDPMGENVLSVTVNKNLNIPDINVTPIEINTIKLSTYIEKNNIPKIDLMKIDVETHEYEVLQGMRPYLEKFRPTLLIEILEDEVGANVESVLKNMGYLYFNIDENHGIRQVENMTKSDYYNYLVCNEQVAAELSLTNNTAK
jgi:FkbM family methyltransferase